MRSKILGIAAALVVFGMVQVSAETGVGLQGNINAHAASPTYGLSVTFKLDKVPWLFAANLEMNPLYVGFTADRWLANKQLTGRLAYYYGWGFSGGVQLADPVAISPGFRVVGGLNMFFLDNALEVYLQGAWNPYIGFYIGSESGIYPDTLPGILLNFPCALGIRFWF